MGSSLYFQVEVKSGLRRHRPRWWHFARFFLPQDPLLYALLAGFRADELLNEGVMPLAPKGLPADVSEATLEEDSLTIDDEAAELEVPDTCSRESAEEYVGAGHSRYLHGGFAVTHPDFHSHSWVTPEELQSVHRHYATMGGLGADELGAVLALMEALHVAGSPCRAVFWFSP